MVSQAVFQAKIFVSRSGPWTLLLSGLQCTCTALATSEVVPVLVLPETSLRLCEMASSLEADCPDEIPDDVYT